MPRACGSFPNSILHQLYLHEGVVGRFTIFYMKQVNLGYGWDEIQSSCEAAVKELEPVPDILLHEVVMRLQWQPARAVVESDALCSLAAQMFET